MKRRLSPQDQPGYRGRLIEAKVAEQRGELRAPKKRLRSGFSKFNFIVNGFVIASLAFAGSGAFGSIQNWREHNIIIHTDVTREILNPELRLTADDFKQINCLARNSYFEAGNQGEQGMNAVDNVVFNRMHSGLFPNGVCQVVYQGHMTRDPLTGLTVVAHNQCQFSWYCDGKKHTVSDQVRWKMAYEVAYNKFVYEKAMPDPTGHATYYHAFYVHPDWSQLHKTTTIGAHLFFKADPGFHFGHHHRRHAPENVAARQHPGEVAENK